jgi:DNA helicase-2/ATP-dependent DNA helicase PcrA
LPSRFIGEIPAGLIKWLTPQLAKHVPARSSAYVDEPRVAHAPRSGNGWRIGQGVRHAKFGEGIIVNLDGSGNDARAQINFGSAGMKWLDLSIAKLEAA